MRSIQTKIILLILLVIVVSAAILGGAGIISSKAAIDSDSVQIMNLLCSEKAQELNSTLGRIEQSVEIMGEYAVSHIESIEKLVNDEQYRNDYTAALESLGMTAARKTIGAVAYYMRFAPDKFSSCEGFFRVKNRESGEFEPFELTDFSKYSPDDVEHLGWYYIPVNAGRSMWVSPYFNKNVGIYMISYVEPIYNDGEIIGVVGMDIDFDYISSFIDGITLYETGYAFLTDNELNIVYHKDSTVTGSVRDLRESFSADENSVISDNNRLYEYTWNGSVKRLALRSLNNGMCLAVTAPVQEIDSVKIQLVHQIIFAAVIIALVFILVSSAIAKTLIRPLKELNTAAKEIAGGNLSVTLTSKSKDEIGTLTESFRETADQLKTKMDYINSLAYTDSLTGIKNNTAYLQDVSGLKPEIENGSAEFALAVIDVNGLKQINDNYGHEYGNVLITLTAQAASEVFGRDNVYRIGGDEFAVLMKNTDGEKLGELVSQFRGSLKNMNGTITVAAAIGTAGFEKDSDRCFEEVFRRADEEMYKNKVEMKDNNEISRVLSEAVPL